MGVRYISPEVDKPCCDCEYRRYDSFHNELWCDHDPKPEGLNGRRLIDCQGTCEYWTKVYDVFEKES